MRIISKVLVCLLVVVGWSHAWAQRARGNANQAQVAGRITALLNAGTIERGTGTTATKAEAEKGERVQWNDTLSTSEDGRLRVLLKDQSILSLGSKSRMVVVEHNPATQQTALEVAYGRVRAKVTEITQSGGSFEIRTPTAVAGVIGTDFLVNVDEHGETAVTCLNGKVRVRNADAKVKGEVIIPEGHTTRVKRGARPAKASRVPQKTLDHMRGETDVNEGKGSKGQGKGQGHTGKGKKGK